MKINLHYIHISANKATEWTVAIRFLNLYFVFHRFVCSEYKYMIFIHPPIVKMTERCKEID